MVQSKAATVAWGCKQTRAEDALALEKVWFTLDQLASDRFKAILQGTGHLRGTNCGVSQKMVED